MYPAITHHGIKPTFKERRDFKSNRLTYHIDIVSTLYRCLIANIEPMFVKRRQNNIDMTLSTFQPIFNQILTL